jgi:predicted flap endonuclease-1-like 5' DNA nuclease
MAGFSFPLLFPMLQAEPGQEGVAWWVWLIILVLAILLVWWLISRQARYTPASDKHIEIHAEPAPARSSELPAPLVEVEPIPAVETEPLRSAELFVPGAASYTSSPPSPADDLLIIEGIGPKIKAVFQAAGITTFAQLASEDPARLKKILDAAGLHLANPATWPEQARLAAANDWEALRVLQGQLKAGLRAG